MELNTEQEFAVNAFLEGSNVKVVAVPGAGKSRVLIECCRQYTRGLILILAYNHDLCEETNAKIAEAKLESVVVCMTFHGLATYCIMPTYDDMALFDAIEGVESGELEVNHTLCVSAVMIDEAQDFRPSFKRLMNIVLKVKENVQYMVVGDPRQMLYDYDEEDCADLKYLGDPSAHFVSSRPWESVVFHKTHRLPPQVAIAVSQMFNLRLESAKQSNTGKPVQVISINLWKTGWLVADIIKGLKPEEVMILVPKKKGNGPLKATLNYLSARGVRIYLHGFDGQDARIKHKKLSVGTWHSSKGTEKKVVVVLGVDDESKTNPCFVALTRSIQHLIIIQDVQNPYKPLMQVLPNLSSDIISVCDETRALMQCAKKPRSQTSGFEASCTFALDGWRPKGVGRWIREHQDIEVKHKLVEMDDVDDVVCSNNSYEDVSTLYALACCMSVEYQRSGKVRLLDDIRSPIRLIRDKQDAAILNGHNSRFVSPNVPESSLLPNGAADALDMYLQGCDITPKQWCELACVGRGWNDFHHTIRQTKPFDWFNEALFERACEFLNSHLDADAEFDVRLRKESPEHPVMLHARTHVVSARGVYCCVWTSEITHQHRIDATIRAALHKSRSTAFIVNLRNFIVEEMVVRNADAFLKKVLVP